MNDLIRPSLYEAWHEVKELENKEISSDTYDLAGPVCETCLLYTSPSPRDRSLTRMPSSA